MDIYELRRDSLQEKEIMEFRKSKIDMKFSKLDARIEELEAEVERSKPYKEEY